MATIISESLWYTFGTYSSKFYGKVDAKVTSRTSTSVTATYTVTLRLVPPSGGYCYYNNNLNCRLTINGSQQDSFQVKPQTSGQYSTEQTWSASKTVTTSVSASTTSVPVTCLIMDGFNSNAPWFNTEKSGTLTFEQGIEYVTINTTGSWYDNNNEDSLRPASFQIHLYGDGAYYDSRTITDNFSTSFTVPKLNSYGNEINYTITSDSIPNYYCSPWENSSVDNLWHVDMFRITSISGTITYPAGEVKEVTVSLYKNGTLSETITTTNIYYSFNGYPVYEVGDSGSSYFRNTYTVSFSTPDGWEQTQNGLNVIYNSVTPSYSSTVTITNYDTDWDAQIYFTSDAPSNIYENGTFQYTDTVEYVSWYNHKHAISGTYYPPDKSNVVIDFSTLLGGSTVTVTVQNYSGNGEIVIGDRDGNYHTLNGSGTFTYTYQGFGVQYVSAHDFLNNTSGTYDLSDPFNVVIDFGEENNTSLHGTITFVGDNEEVRPKSVSATHWSTGSDVGNVYFDVTGSSFEYSYGSYVRDGDEALEFHEIAGYTMTISPANSQYCNKKDVTYTYNQVLPDVITVTVTGDYNNYDISVYFSDAAPEYIYSNGVYTYPVSSYGRVTDVYAVDKDSAPPVQLSVTDYNVVIAFAGGTTPDVTTKYFNISVVDEQSSPSDNVSPTASVTLEFSSGKTIDSYIDISYDGVYWSGHNSGSYEDDGTYGDLINITSNEISIHTSTIFLDGDGNWIVQAFGNFPSSSGPDTPDVGNCYGTITFVGDNSYVRPSVVYVTEFGWGWEYGLIDIPITGATTNYNISSPYNGVFYQGDNGIVFPEISGYTLVVMPDNDAYSSLNKNAVYTYKNNYFVTSNDSIFTENGYSRSGNPQYIINVNGTNMYYETSSFYIDTSTYDLSECVLTLGDTWLRDSNGNEIDATAAGFIVESITYTDTATTRTANITWAYSKTVTVTIDGYSNNYDVVVTDKDDSTHYYYSNGTYTYKGLGAASVQAYDIAKGQTGTVDISDPLNIKVQFSTSADGLSGTIRFIGAPSADVIPSTITCRYFSTGTEGDPVTLNITGSTTEYSYGENIVDGDCALIFPELSGWILTTNPGNEEYSNVKNATYTYDGLQWVTHVPYIFKDGQWVKYNETDVYTETNWKVHKWKVYTKRTEKTTAKLGYCILGKLRLGKG
jgi:hypothetical protein